MKQYEQPMLAVLRLSVNDVLTLSTQGEDSHFNLSWIGGGIEQ